MASVLASLRARRSTLTGEKIQSTKLNKDKIEKHYLLGRELGRGGYARVVLATRRVDKKDYAIKIIDKLKSSRKQMKEVQSEVEILEKLDHPNVVKLIEVFDDESKFYIVMELITGGELFEDIIKKQSYSENVAAHVIAEALKGLQHMHSLGIVHRDIKPENLMLSSDKPGASIKLVDFGCSKELTPKKPLLYDFIGSPGYIAPETYKVMEWKVGIPGYGLPVDMFSVGVIIYIILSGTHPFPLNDDTRLQTCVERGEWNFNGSCWQYVSDMAKDLIEKLMEVDPTKRLTVEQALAHPWLAGHAPSVTLEATQKSLAVFQARRKFQAAVKAIVAVRMIHRWGSTTDFQRVPGTAASGTSTWVTGEKP